MKLSLLIIPLMLTACATPRLEVEHISHVFDGWPLEKQRLSEDDVTQLNLLAHWKGQCWYADAGLGYNLQGRNGGGFYGDPLTATARMGIEFKRGCR